MTDFEVDIAALRLLSDGLQSEAHDLRSRRVDPSPQPDAGRSTGESQAAIAHLVNSTADLANVMEYIATRLRECADNYDSADNRSIAELGELLKRMPQR